MTSPQWSLLCLGLIFLCAVYSSYYIVLWKFKLSLFQRGLLHVAFMVLAFTAFGAFVSLMLGSFVAIPYLLLFTFPFVIIGSVVSWLGELFALRAGKDYKRFAKEARERGEYERARQLEKQYKKSVFHLKLFGGAKELDKLESESPSVSSAEDETDVVLATLNRLFKRQPQ